MGHDMHENLELLDKLIEELDPSPAEMLILFNHLVGRLAARVDEETWAHALAAARLAMPQSRSEAP